DLREVGTDRRSSDLAGLVARDTAGLRGEDDLARLRVARQLHFSRRAAGRRRAHGLGNVVELDVGRAAPRLQERREGPDLGAVERDRRLVDVGHDVRVALDDVGVWLQQRLDDVGLGAHPRLRLPGASADAVQVGRARSLLADAVADLARALGV